MREDGRMARAPELSRDAWRDLFARLAAGDSSALEPLYRAAAGPVFGLALWRTGSVEDASDVLQEVFLRLAQRHRRLGKVENPRSWLLGVAHHVAIDVARRRKRRATEPLDEVPFLAAPETDHVRGIDAAHAAAEGALGAEPTRVVGRPDPGGYGSLEPRHEAHEGVPQGRACAHAPASSRTALEVSLTLERCDLGVLSCVTAGQDSTSRGGRAWLLSSAAPVC